MFMQELFWGASSERGKPTEGKLLREVLGNVWQEHVVFVCSEGQP